MQTDLPAVVSRIVPLEAVPERNGVTVWWSSVTRQGEWILPRIFRAFAFMGNVELDLTSARMAAGTSEMEIRCVMANIELTVPADIRVICDGDGIAGTFEMVRIGEVPPLAPDAPTLRITGTAYLGSVSVKVKGIVGPGWKDKLKAGWQSLNS
jgi:hypothetical protein